MNIQKFILLFVVLPFGAYLQNDAEKSVMEDRQNKIVPALPSSHLPADVKVMERAFELSHMVANRNDPSAHAEVETMRHVCSSVRPTNLKGSVNYASGQPCNMCLSLICHTGIKNMFYCISAKAFDNSALSINHDHTILLLQHDKPISEIPMMQEKVKRLIQSYKIIKTDTVL